MKKNNFFIPKKVVSKKYILKNNQKFSLAYNLNYHTISIFENDSAEVWNIIYENNGNISKAYNYIYKNGNFTNQEKEAFEVLDGFLKQL